MLNISLANDINIKIHSNSLTSNSENWIPVKFFTEYSIWYMLKGSIKIKMDDHEFIAREGDAILFYPNRLYSCIPMDKDFVLRSINFDISFSESSHLFELTDMSGLYSASILNKSEIVFNDIFIKSLPNVVLKGYLLIILGIIFSYHNEIAKFDNYISNFSGGIPNKLQVIYEYIYSNIDKKITIKDVANLANLSRNYFCAFFKKATGTSLQDVIYRAKMIKAKEYISINKHSVKTASYMLGYEDQNSFSKAFKRYHKVSPSTFM